MKKTVLLLSAIVAVLTILINVKDIIGWFMPKPAIGTFLFCNQSRQVVQGIVAILPDGSTPVELVPNHDGFIFVPRKQVGSTMSVRDEQTRQELLRYVVPDFGKEINEVIIRK